MSSQKTRCITCGHDVGDPPALNRLASGEVCPTCMDRVLEGVPAALPSQEPDMAGPELAELGGGEAAGGTYPDA